MTRDEALSVLQLPPGASEADIRATYLQAARWCHPDRAPGNKIAEATFQRISEAYGVLTKKNGSSGHSSDGLYLAEGESVP